MVLLMYSQIENIVYQNEKVVAGWLLRPILLIVL